MTNATITLEDLRAMEEAGYALIRIQDEKAWTLLALVLRLSAESGLTTETFACNIDESAGMEEFSKRVGSNVVEMSDYWGVSGRSA